MGTAERKNFWQLRAAPLRCDQIAGVVLRVLGASHAPTSLQDTLAHFPPRLVQVEKYWLCRMGSECLWVRRDAYPGRFRHLHEAVGYGESFRECVRYPWVVEVVKAFHYKEIRNCRGYVASNCRGKRAIRIVE